MTGVTQVHKTAAEPFTLSSVLTEAECFKIAMYSLKEHSQVMANIHHCVLQWGYVHNSVHTLYSIF